MSKVEGGHSNASSQAENCLSPSPNKKKKITTRKREADGGASASAAAPFDHFQKPPDVSSACFQKFVTKSLGTAPSSSTSSITGWAPELLEECAQAVNENDGGRTQHLMWMLNELSSPYGDLEQRLASAFLQALFARLTRTGFQFYQSLCSAAARSHSYQSQKKMMLKFQELSPWMTVGIVGANGAILEALSGEKKVHIVDISNNFCTQWPTLFEALAMRAEHPPHLRLTTISVSKDESQTSQQVVMTEITHRLEKFARLMGIPFEFKVLHQQQEVKIEAAMLDVRDGEALIVNSFQSLQHTPETSRTQHDQLVSLFTGLRPKIVIIVEDEVDLVSPPQFITCFREALRFYSVFFDALDNTFPKTSNERLMLERIAARKIVAALTGDDMIGAEDGKEHCHWKVMMQRAGFVTSLYRDEVVDDIQALLRRYKPGWALYRSDIGLFLTWKDQNAISVSVWKST